MHPKDVGEWHASVRDDIAERYQDEFSTHLYRDLTAPPCRQTVRSEIEEALRERTPIMQQPLYNGIGNQQVLARILCRIAAKLPLMGYNCHFARFVAAIYALMNNEMIAYKVSMVFYDRLHLGDYFGVWVPGFSGPSADLEEDVKRTVTKIQILWPDLLNKFQDFDCLEDLNALVRGLLQSLLMQGYQEDWQSFMCFLPLLHRLVTEYVPPEDPRMFLRHCVACIVGRQYEEIETCIDAADLRHCCELVGSKIPVDLALQRLLEFKIEVPNENSAYALNGASVGCITGALVANSMRDSLPDVVFDPVVTLLAMACGAAFSYTVGWVSCNQSLPESASQVIADADKMASLNGRRAVLDQAVSTDVDQPSALAEQTMLAAPSRPEGDEEDEDQEKPIFEGVEVMTAALEHELWRRDFANSRRGHAQPPLYTHVFLKGKGSGKAGPAAGPKMAMAPLPPASAMNMSSGITVLEPPPSKPAVPKPTPPMGRWRARSNSPTLSRGPHLFQ